MFSSAKPDTKVIPFPAGAGKRIRLLWTCLRHELPDEYALELGDDGIVVSHRRHVMGLWRDTRDCLAYIPLARGEPSYVTGLLSEAIQYTRLLIGGRAPV